MPKEGTGNCGKNPRIASQESQQPYQKGPGKKGNKERTRRPKTRREKEHSQKEKERRGTREERE
eukprot:3022466-Prorocentrum_lima.AAC.1